jgi:short subunit dehydrogenase-like uncharacterized protein
MGGTVRWTPTNNDWVLYGATGRTGTPIALEALARGHRPVLAGRDAERVRLLAERLDLPWVAGPATELGPLLGDARLVLLAAAPFGTTAPPALRACLAAGVHYLDIANDIAVAEAVLASDDAARRFGITALPAVGFGTVAADGLARHVAEQVPHAIRLELAVLLETDGSSAGARASRMQALSGGGRIRRDGRIVSTRLGAGAHRQGTPVGDRTLVPAPTADLVVSAHTTGIPNITTSVPMPLPPAIAKLVMPALPAIARASGKRPPRARTRAPNARTDEVVSYVWARATDADGHRAEAWARTGEGYAYTARAVVLTVEATLQARALGATTVARAFGAELSFAAGSELLPGAHRESGAERR